METEPPHETQGVCPHTVSRNPERRFIARRALFAISAGALVAWKTCRPTLAATGEGNIVQPQSGDEKAFMQRALEMRQQAIAKGDQAYGAVVTRDGLIIGQSWSRVVLDKDPTAHAEIAAIRDAARRTKSSNLSGAVMYSSSRPCPMCEAAAHWAGLSELVHGRSMNKAGPPVLCR